MDIVENLRKVLRIDAALVGQKAGGLHDGTGVAVNAVEEAVQRLCEHVLLLLAGIIIIMEEQFL